MRPTVVLFVASLALGGFVAAGVDAHPVVLGKPDAKKPKAEPGPTAVEKKIKLAPDGLTFGVTVDELSKLYEKFFDDEFVPRYKETDPGPRMAELDAELADKKQLILRNKLDFGTLPSGLDNTPLAGEYTYNNGESMSQLKLRGGIQRYFFFVGDHLWKVYDIHKLGKKSKLGEDYDGVVQALTKQLGKPPRARAADPSAGRNLDQADWEDKDTILRVIDHGNGNAGLVYVDRKIEENIDRYRTNKGGPKEGLDRDVSDVTKPNNGKPNDNNKNVSDAYTKGKKQP